DLSSNQQQNFITTLKQIHPQKRVILRCAAGDFVCTAVGQFIELFQRADWTVGHNAVDRGFLGRPQFGVVILVNGSGTIPDPDDPKYGLWTRVVNPERDAIIRAFKSINIVIGKTMVDSQLKETEIAVVFG